MSDDTTTETATVEEATTEVQETQSTTEGDETALGDAGKKALDAMKAERNQARADAKARAAELEKLKAELANKDKPAEEQAIEAAKAEARKEATDKANERLLRSELKAVATGKLADPTDAPLYINLSEFTVSDDGEVDADALAEAVADLLTRKPHLAAGKQTRFDGAADQGAKGKEAKPGQLTQHDLESMSPEAINAARREGRLNKLLGVNQ